MLCTSTHALPAVSVDAQGPSPCCVLTGRGVYAVMHEMIHPQVSTGFAAVCWLFQGACSCTDGTSALSGFALLLDVMTGYCRRRAQLDVARWYVFGGAVACHPITQHDVQKLLLNDIRSVCLQIARMIAGDGL
jgi:hypothetical protein